MIFFSEANVNEFTKYYRFYSYFLGTVCCRARIVWLDCRLVVAPTCEGTLDGLVIQEACPKIMNRLFLREGILGLSEKSILFTDG